MVVLLAAAHPAVRVPQKLRVPNGKIFDLTFQSVHFLGANRTNNDGLPTYPLRLSFLAALHP